MIDHQVSNCNKVVILVCLAKFFFILWYLMCSLQAAAVAHSLFCLCYKFNLQVENATVLLLLAEIHKV